MTEESTHQMIRRKIRERYLRRSHNARVAEERWLREQKNKDQRIADHSDGFDRDDVGQSPEF